MRTADSSLLNQTPGAEAPSPSSTHQVFGPASAEPTETLTVPNPHQPLTLTSPTTFVSALCVDRSAVPLPGDVDEPSLSSAIRRWTACLHVDQDVIDRLFQLWNGLSALDADEVSDWAIPARCDLVDAGGHPLPLLLGICARVFSNGEASFALTLEGIVPALAFVDVVDLTEFATSDVGAPA